MLEDVFKMNMILDYYGDLLSEKQRKSMKLYYNFDYSLNEIAEDLNISKQAVSENLKRGEQNLEEFEDKLQLIKSRKFTEQKNKRLKILFEELKKNSKDIDLVTLNKIYDELFNGEVTDGI